MIKIDFSQYRGAWGKPPRGNGVWKFQIDTSHVSIYGEWKDAKKKVLKLAELAKATTLLLIP